MHINGRLLLLVVVIGLFVRVWKTNERPRTIAIERSRSQAAKQVHAPTIAATEPAQQATPVSVRRDRDERATIEECWTVATSPIPLPAGITAGTYRVINDAGRVAKLNVVATDASLVGASPAAAVTDFLMTVAGTERWYLVRLRSEATAVRTGEVADTAATLVSPVVPETATPADAPAANRKFDFSGYDTEPARNGELSDSHLLEQASRPAPPELPSPL